MTAREVGGQREGCVCIACAGKTLTPDSSSPHPNCPFFSKEL